MSTSYDVRIWNIETITGKRGTTYRVRWVVGRNAPFPRTFSTKRLAESFRSDLISAARKGEAFDIETGLPQSLIPKATSPSWLTFAMDHMDVKWADFSPNTRKSTADGLTTITIAMVDDDDTPPDDALLRKALRTWAFNSLARAKNPEPPEEYRDVIAWIAKRSRPVDDLNDAATTRRVLKAISLKLDGRPAAAKTANRKRAAFSSAIGYALELGYLESNPLQRVKVKRAVTAEELDTRVVVNHRQAKRLLAAVHASDPELEAFIACIYYAAMRPAEVRNLSELDLTLPAEGWGEARLTGSYQDPGKDWTDDGTLGEERGLKHRARNSVRPTPLPPPLVKLLRRHLEKFGTGPDGRLFVVRAGKWGHALPASLSRPVPLSAVGRVMKKARAAAFTEEEQDSPLARRAYDLRHAAVSTWLAAGTPAPLVAKWAGHSVQVLLTVYAHAVDGQEDAARKRIEQALTDDGGAEE